ncbi:hypothetical protein J4Q44_G00098520 [Coregonus suidteri]|uniref:Uncharacterized protein n=1 Tax=Coregonus suidteri TaxID=861788 RepID=A0AAN8LXS0_9TELE
MRYSTSDYQQRQRASSRRRRVTIAVSVAPPIPMYPSPHSVRRRQQRGRSLTTFDSPAPRSSSPTRMLPLLSLEQKGWYSL